MRSIASLKCLIILSFLSNTSSNAVAQASSTLNRDATAQTSPVAIDPDGQKAWRTHGFTIEHRKNLREPFERAIEKHFIPGGALLVIHRGDVIFREGFGVANIETKRPFTVDAPCRIASVTKPHTATLIAMLVDQGKLAWDDPVDRYLPKFSKPISPKRLKPPLLFRHRAVA